MQIVSSLCCDRVFSDLTQDLKIALLQKPLLGDVAEKWATFCARRAKFWQTLGSNRPWLAKKSKLKVKISN
jgi:hypothetical protein